MAGLKVHGRETRRFIIYILDISGGNHVFISGNLKNYNELYLTNRF